MGDKEHAAIKVDVLRALVEKLTPAHPGVESRDHDLAEMRRSRIEKFCFFRHAHDRSRLPPLFREPDAGKRVCGQEALVNRPIKEMAKDFDVTVERGVGELLLLVPRGAELPRRSLGDGADGPFAEMGQQHFEPVDMVGTR